MEAVKLFAKWNKTEIDYAMLNSLGIKEMEKKQYIQLSTGQKRRLHLALALIGNPDVIFLDEPTAGLDVEGRLSLHEQIRKLKSCLLYTSDAADEARSVDLGGRRIIKKIFFKQKTAYEI